MRVRPSGIAPPRRKTHDELLAAEGRPDLILDMCPNGGTVEELLVLDDGDVSEKDI
jgi:hypothetical protein